MKRILFSVIMLTALFYGCVEDNYHDSGLANGVFKGTVWEYMQANNQWDSARLIIERAGLTGIFDGTDPEYKDGITFFGFTNFTVWRFMANTLDENDNRIYNCINDMPVDLCRKMTLDYVVKGKRMKESFDYEVRGTLTGGTEVETLSGITLRIYRIKNQHPLTGAADKGPEDLAIHAQQSGHIAVIASSDNEADNGVVHSLPYTFLWSELQ